MWGRRAPARGLGAGWGAWTPREVTARAGPAFSASQAPLPLPCSRLARDRTLSLTARPRSGLRRAAARQNAQWERPSGAPASREARWPNARSLSREKRQAQGGARLSLRRTCPRLQPSPPFFPQARPPPLPPTSATDPQPDSRPLPSGPVAITRPPGCTLRRAPSLFAAPPRADPRGRPAPRHPVRQLLAQVPCPSGSVLTPATLVCACALLRDLTHLHVPAPLDTTSPSRRIRPDTFPDVSDRRGDGRGRASQTEGALEEKHESWNNQQELGPELSGEDGTRAAVTTEGRPRRRAAGCAAGRRTRSRSFLSPARLGNDAWTPHLRPPAPSRPPRPPRRQRKGAALLHGAPGPRGVSRPRRCFRCGHRRARGFVPSRLRSRWQRGGQERRVFSKTGSHLRPGD